MTIKDRLMNAKERIAAVRTTRRELGPGELTFIADPANAQSENVKALAEAAEEWGWH